MRWPSAAVGGQAGPSWTKPCIDELVEQRVNHLLEALMALEQVTFQTADHEECTLSFKKKRKPKLGQG